MRGNNSDWTLSEYLWPAVPKLFSETVSALERAEFKIGRGGDLHTDDIAEIRDSFHEESLDAQTLKTFVWTKASLFVWDFDGKADMANAVFSDIRESHRKVAERVVRVLSETSWASMHFKSALSYFELCESRKWRPDDPWIVEDVLFRFIGEDFDAARSAMEAISLEAGDAIADVQGRIAYAAQSPEKADSLPNLILERAVVAESLRQKSEKPMERVKSDFEKLRKRAAKHGYKLSFVWN